MHCCVLQPAISSDHVLILQFETIVNFLCIFRLFAVGPVENVCEFDPIYFISLNSQSSWITSKLWWCIEGMKSKQHHIFGDSDHCTNGKHFYLSNVFFIVMCLLSCVIVASLHTFPIITTRPVVYFHMLMSSHTLYPCISWYRFTPFFYVTPALPWLHDDRKGSDFLPCI